MLELKIIVGSTRPGRAADLVTPWVVDRARAHGGFAVEVLDLRDWPLPMFTETVHTIGDVSDPTYSDPLVRSWNRTIKAGDAFLVITPEYLHSVPGVLKNALDSVFVSYGMRNKPMGLVGYSAGPIGGARAVEHLAHIAIEAEAVPLRNTVLVSSVGQAFVDGEPTAPGSDIALQITLDDLQWWGSALKAARDGGELPPGNARFRTALAALSSSTR
jgi:NAD(P)H-dependent FMN reductase